MTGFRKAVRKGTPALISLWGVSGSGKTYSALTLARGLVGPEGTIGLIDTENGRSEFYADQFGGTKGPWDHFDLQPPFTPQRYIEAMRDAEAQGYDCIIIDSMSHVWEGQGGVLDMADSGRSRGGKELDGLKKWQAPKMAYKRMVNELIRARCNVIFCLRAKNKVEQKGGDIVDKGLVPICEKNFTYEMTIDAQLIKESHVPGELKCPEALLDSFPRNKVITLDTGRKIALWVGSGAKVDTALELLKRAARDAAMQGSVAFRDWWQTSEMTSPQKNAINASMKEELKSLADAADLEQAGGHAPDNDGDPLADKFTPENAA